MCKWTWRKKDFSKRRTLLIESPVLLYLRRSSSVVRDERTFFCFLVTKVSSRSGAYDQRVIDKARSMRDSVQSACKEHSTMMISLLLSTPVQPCGLNCTYEWPVDVWPIKPLYILFLTERTRFLSWLNSSMNIRNKGCTFFRFEYNRQDFFRVYRLDI